jgi:hypothetical protein
MEKIKSLFQNPSVAIGISAALLVLLCITCASFGFYAIGSPSMVNASVAETLAAIPTGTNVPTYTPPPTIVVTKLVIVTPESTATPIYTPTITNTPLPPTSTPDRLLTSTAEAMEKLTADKGDGFYLVNIDIAPGVWRSTGTGNSCYWATTTATGDIIDNHFGMSGGTAYISPNAFQIEFEDCGTWVFISAP